MNLKLLSGYVLLVICAGVVAFVGIIVLMNTGDTWKLHVVTRDIELSRAAWLLIAAGGGIIIFLDLFWLLPRTIRSLRLGARAAQGVRVPALRRYLRGRQQPRLRANGDSGPVADATTGNALTRRRV